MSYEQRDSRRPAGEVEPGDPHGLLLGDGLDDPDGFDGETGDSGEAGEPDAAEPRGRRRAAPARQQRRQRARRRRRRRFVVLLAALAVAIVAISGWLVVRPIVDSQLSAKDYSGQGTGDVRIRINPGDDAGTIGATLKKAGVVRTVGAFTAAAKNNANSRSIQPGLYQLHRQMSGAAAVSMLLDPTARLVISVTIPEGTTEQAVVDLLAKALQVSPDTVRQAAADVGQLGLPDGYSQQSGALPASAEGFLYPDTYRFDADVSASDALQQMVSEYGSVDRSLKFSTAVAALGLTPYQGLTIASMIEGEAKFSADRAKVARVILNRMAKNMTLGIDATAIYGAKLAGQDPSKVNLDAPGPYSRQNKQLPPTPIGNPGSAALTAAAHPATGSWLYYVNGDAAGHLAFFTDEHQWAAAVQRCVANHWGCD